MAHDEVGWTVCTRYRQCKDLSGSRFGLKKSSILSVRHGEFAHQEGSVAPVLDGAEVGIFDEPVDVFGVVSFPFRAVVFDLERRDSHF